MAGKLKIYNNNIRLAGLLLRFANEELKQAESNVKIAMEQICLSQKSKNEYIQRIKKENGGTK